MPITLNEGSFEYARKLIAEGRFVVDEQDRWSEHRPSTGQENAFIEEHGMDEYERWHLGIDHELPEDAKTRCKFPYGDFDTVHRCAVLSLEARAHQYRYRDIEVAAAHLHGLIDGRSRTESAETTPLPSQH